MRRRPMRPRRRNGRSVNAADDEYRHVRLAGRFLHDRETLVQAVDRARRRLLGADAAADRATGSLVLVNRGFVPSRAARSRGARRQRAGRRSRDHRPAAHHRARRRLPAPQRSRRRPLVSRATCRPSRRRAAWREVAPFFVDADAPAPRSMNAAAEPRWPAGGLTVIAFHNNHLVYALTWFALALMVAGAAWLVVRTRAQAAAPRRATETRECSTPS